MILFRTLWHRWYAFAFIGAFFWAAAAERGRSRAARFLGIAALLSLASELLSTNSPFPYGRYHYLPQPTGTEIHIASVPLFVPLSFGVVVWAGRALATAGFGARRPGAVILGGAATATVLDLVIDPITLRGYRWFLGPLYYYDAGGGWFGVPWSNAGGWLLVSVAVLWVDELLDVREARAIEPIRGPTLAFGILIFHVLIALLTTNYAIAAVGALITAVLFGLTAPRIAALVREAGEEPAPP